MKFLICRSPIIALIGLMAFSASCVVNDVEPEEDCEIVHGFDEPHTPAGDRISSPDTDNGTHSPDDDVTQPETDPEPEQQPEPSDVSYQVSWDALDLSGVDAHAIPNSAKLNPALHPNYQTIPNVVSTS